MIQPKSSISGRFPLFFSNCFGQKDRRIILIFFLSSSSNQPSQPHLSDRDRLHQPHHLHGAGAGGAMRKRETFETGDGWIGRWKEKDAKTLFFFVRMTWQIWDRLFTMSGNDFLLSLGRSGTE
jgi:hypothetical protein